MEQKDEVIKIQVYVGDYKIYTKKNFWYISPDGVSKHKDEDSFKKTIADGNMSFHFKYKGIHESLYNMLSVGVLPTAIENTNAVALINIREMIKKFKVTRG